MPEFRGRGYATEAGLALVELGDRTMATAPPQADREILAYIDPRNKASRRVIEKLGFEFWKLAEVNGYDDNIFRRTFG